MSIIWRRRETRKERKGKQFCRKVLLKRKERLAENEEVLKKKEKEWNAERALIELERNNLESERK